ncbi:MAG: alpha-mannosidase [Bacteroidales bacterium]|nr:alpha-mannosidase [Bacteroidales bacterium]
MKKTALTIIAAILAFTALAQQNERTIYMASNAHLDTQWRWTVQQVIGEYLPNTLYQNFGLLEMSPDYKFSFEGAVKYYWFKEYYPEAFEKLKKYVAEGRWYTSGGWDANDYNVPSAESNIRNILLGEEFYKNELGVKSIDIMLPDCFGFGYTLPTIANHCGLYAFHTQKLQWRTNPFYEGGKKWPFEFGVWQGIDGSRILAHLNGGAYGFSPNGLINDDPQLKKMVDDSPTGVTMRYYGTKSSRMAGDRGGSPLPSNIRWIEESIKAGGDNYSLRFATVADIFRDNKDLLNKDVLPVFDGELLMDVHGSGVYTANSDTKKLNRRCEQLGYAAEASAVMADWVGAVPYPKYIINDAYQRFIWHQFHDDLPGTCITEAYTFSWNDFMLAQNQFSNTMEASAGGFSSALDTRVKGTPVVVFNPVSSDNADIVTVDVEIPAPYSDVQVFGPDGKPVKSQVICRENGKAKLIFAASDPSVSLSVYDFRYVKSSPSGKSSLKASGKTIENKIYKLEVGETGDIVSLIDKRVGKELVAAGSAFGLQIFDENTSDAWPSWEILKSVIDKDPLKVDTDVKVSVESTGPLAAVLRVDRRYEESTITQRIILYDGACDDRIDILNNIDWKSRRTLLKAAFPCSFSNEKAAYDLGLGHVMRGNNTITAYEVPAQEWADLTAADGSYGVTVMNDCRYGWDKPADNTIRLTLLHTPTADRGYSNEKTLDIAPHEFTYSIVGHPGALDGAAATTAADILNQRKSAYVTEKHAGSLGKSFSLLSTTNGSIRVKAVKKAEDGDGIIVRVYELSGKDAQGSVRFAAPVLYAEETNGVEERIGGATFSGNSLNVNITRFAPKTFRVRLQAPAAKVSAPVYKTVEVPFNKTAISSDSFSAFGRMDMQWHSYAAEQIPEDFVYKGVPFALGEKDVENSAICNGQEIALPAGTKGVYLLLASTNEKGSTAVFNAGKPAEISVPYWTGFFGGGNWAPYKAFLTDGDAAYVGSHRHDAQTRNEPYVQTYMYMKYIPATSGTLVLPKDRDVTVFAATALTDGGFCAEEISDSVTHLERQ